jgi:hypothetical protein
VTATGAALLELEHRGVSKQTVAFCFNVAFNSTISPGRINDPDRKLSLAPSQQTRTALPSIQPKSLNTAPLSAQSRFRTFVMKSLLYFLAFGSLALADIDFFSDDPSFTYSPTSAFTMVGDFGASGCGGQWDLFSQPASFTFKFPTSSTSFKWWGWKFPAGQGGQASVCLDGAKGSACATVNTTDITSSTPIVLFSLTGLSNTIHTVTVTNIPDPSQGDALGMLTVDHFSIDGTVSPPSFAQGTTLATVPMEPTYHIPLTLGGHSPPLEGVLSFPYSCKITSISDFLVCVLSSPR